MATIPMQAASKPETLEATPPARQTRLQRAVAEAMKLQEGPELLAKITNREFKDAFQAIAVQQRGFSEPYDVSSIPVVQMNYDPEHPDDKSKQLYECKLGSGVMTPESGKLLKATAAERGIRLTHKGEFNHDHWFKATTVTIQSRDLAALIGLVNDVLIEKVRPDARVGYDDIMQIAQDEIGRVLNQ